jgi:hypothetical protein
LWDTANSASRFSRTPASRYSILLPLIANGTLPDVSRHLVQHQLHGGSHRSIQLIIHKKEFDLPKPAYRRRNLGESELKKGIPAKIVQRFGISGHLVDKTGGMNAPSAASGPKSKPKTIFGAESSSCFVDTALNIQSRFEQSLISEV